MVGAILCSMAPSIYPTLTTETLMTSLRAPQRPLYPQLPGTRIVCKLIGHVWAPEWWARQEYDRPSVCLRCRLLGEDVHDG